VDLAIDDQITDTTFGLQAEDDIPQTVELRDRLSVTLLSKRTVANQIRKGRQLAYDLGRTRALIERNSQCAERDEPVTVLRSEISVFEGRVIFARIMSPELDQEIDAIHEILGSVGLKGFAKKEKPFVPHMTLGVAEKGKRLSRTETKHVKSALEAGLPDAITLEGWDVYSSDGSVEHVLQDQPLATY
jgi:hypothetical protein